MSSDLQSHSSVIAFQMKGGIYTLTTLELHSANSSRIREQLQHMTRKAPNFFQQTPVVIALEKMPAEEKHLDLSSLRHLLHEFGIILVAVRGGTDTHRKEASICGIAWLPTTKSKASDTTESEASANVVMIKKRDHITATEEEQQSKKPERPAVETTTRIIERPVRSGQQVYSPGDLVVLGPVSTGSELLAGGHIHVYGPLRGRALAGINGNKDARIFCRQFEAELISICGQYKLPANTDKSHWGRSVLINLKDQCLHMTEL